jgi:hypothetical protein
LLPFLERRHPCLRLAGILAGNYPLATLAVLLVSSVRQHSSDPLEVAVRNQNINIQISLPLVGFLRQDVARVRMAPLDLTGGRNAKTLCRSFMCF